MFPCRRLRTSDRSAGQVGTSRSTAIGTSSSRQLTRMGGQSVLALQRAAGNRAALAAVHAARWAPESRRPALARCQGACKCGGPAGRPEPTTSGRPRWAGAFDGPSRPGGTARKLHQRVAVAAGARAPDTHLPAVRGRSPARGLLGGQVEDGAGARDAVDHQPVSKVAAGIWSTVACPSVPPDPPAMASTGSTDRRPRRP